MAVSLSEKLAIRDFKSFETNSGLYKSFALEISQDLQKPTYQIYSVDSIAKILVDSSRLDLNEVIVLNVVHWANILQRTHFTCATGLLRNLRWLDVISSSRQNYFGVSAGLRGFVEAASDTFDALALAPEALADCKNYFDIFVKGGQLNYFLSPEILEDKLLHFVFARRPRKKEAPDPITKAKQSADYIKEMERSGAPGLYALYQDLCEVVHPASQSITHFETEKPDGYGIKFGNDANEVDEIFRKHAPVFFPFFQLAFNPILMSLAVLNEYPVQALHTSRRINRYVEVLPKWRVVADLLQHGPRHLIMKS